MNHPSTAYNMQDNLAILVLSAIIALAILYFIIEAATGKNKQIRNQLTIIALLVKLCKQQGVPKDELIKIGDAYGFDFKNT